MDSHQIWVDPWGRIFTIGPLPFAATNQASLTVPNPEWFLTEDQYLNNTSQAYQTLCPHLKVEHKEAQSVIELPSLLQNYYEHFQNRNPVGSTTALEQATSASVKVEVKVVGKKKKTGESEDSEEYSSAFSVYEENDEKPNQEGERKRTSWKTVCSRRDSLNRFRRIVLSRELTTSPEQIVKEFQADLTIRIRNDILAAYGKYNEHLLSSELALARKSLTQHFIKILRLAIEVIKGQEITVLHKQSLERVKLFLKSVPPRISSLLELYRRPDFRFYVDFLKSQVLLERKLPELIMALNIKSTEKLVMLPLVSSYIHAIRHPELEIRSWKSENNSEEYQIHSIVKDLRQHNMTYEEVMEKLMEVQQQLLIGSPQKKQRSKYSNLSYRFKTLLIKIALEAAKTLPSEEERAELEGLRNRIPTSLEGVRQLLRVSSLRKYIQEVSIPSKQMIIEILEDSTLDIRSKVPMLECYPLLLKALENPESLKGWQPDSE